MSSAMSFIDQLWSAPVLADAAGVIGAHAIANSRTSFDGEEMLSAYLTAVGWNYSGRALAAAYLPNSGAGGMVSMGAQVGLEAALYTGVYYGVHRLRYGESPFDFGDSAIRTFLINAAGLTASAVGQPLLGLNKAAAAPHPSAPAGVGSAGGKLPATLAAASRAVATGAPPAAK
jgi:hypothetical protein